MTTDTPKPRQYSRRTVLRRGAVTAVATVGVTGATTTASASESTGSVLTDAFGDAEFDAVSFIRGYVSRYGGGYGSPPDVEDLATDARNEFNANADRWIDYGNWLLSEHDLSASGDTTASVEFSISRWRWPTRDESVETSIIVGYDDATDEFTDLEWLAEPADDPDFEIAIEDSAAENAGDELSGFRRDYIGVGDEGHELPENEYLNKIAGKYSGSVGLGSDAQSVLELLLGEVSVDGF